MTSPHDDIDVDIFVIVSWSNVKGDDIIVASPLLWQRVLVVMATTRVWFSLQRSKANFTHSPKTLYNPKVVSRVGWVNINDIMEVDAETKSAVIPDSLQESKDGCASGNSAPTSSEEPAEQTTEAKKEYHGPRWDCAADDKCWFDTRSFPHYITHSRIQSVGIKVRACGWAFPSQLRFLGVKKKIYIIQDCLLLHRCHHMLAFTIYLSLLENILCLL